VPPKLILAIEQSSDLGSIALLKDENILGEMEWNGMTERSAGLFAALKKLLAQVPAQMEDIGTYAIDIGPGSYSGLRASMAAVRAFALPDNKPIYAVTSAEALAFEIFMKVGPDCQSGRLHDRKTAGQGCPALPNENLHSPDLSIDKIQIVGDARRGQLWTCVYKSGDDIPTVRSKLCLVGENDLKAEPDAIIVSPDWHRIGERLKKMASNLITERKVPRAGRLGMLAWRKMRLKMESEPLSPIYLHAAVK
jgi:tRNA threonylcarbamoyl adenosine modification protein YeaZ